MRFPGFLVRQGRPALLALAAALLVACGGGTSQVEDFVAQQYVAFGDEASVLTTDGRKYGVNQLVAETGAISCNSQQIWVQAVAAVYGHVFAECNPDAVVDPKARMRAAVGARVADFTAQIDTHIAAGGFPASSLATVLVGGHDVLDLYAEFPTRSRADLLDAARERGRAVGVQVNRLIGLDVRVIVSTVPDQGLTPYALAQKAAFTDTDRAKLISELTTELNAGIRTTILNDGRFVGLVLADEMVQAMVKSPGSFGLGNVTAEACTVALPNCSTATLVSGADPATWLWADATRMAFGGQSRLGVLAVSRARQNPF
jgi:phospholipase/lecithinase/hemolysin